jgi:hypothetical protein
MKKVRDQSLGKRPRIKKVVSIMKESMEDQLPQNSDTLEDRKTYEDDNKEQLLLIDPSLKRNNQEQVDNTNKEKDKKW